jgi:hypothetical protein
MGLGGEGGPPGSTFKSMRLSASRHCRPERGVLAGCSRCWSGAPCSFLKDVVLNTRAQGHVCRGAAEKMAGSRVDWAREKRRGRGRRCCPGADSPSGDGARGVLGRRGFGGAGGGAFGSFWPAKFYWARRSWPPT